MSTNSAKGYRAERDWVHYLQEVKPLSRVDRMVKHGVHDTGDVVGFRQVTTDVKDHATEKLPAWLSRAREQADNAKARFPFVIKKIRGKSPEEWAVVTDGYTGRAIIALLETIPDEHLETFFATLPSRKERKRRVKTPT